MDLRDEMITGSFAVGADGRKEPIDWKKYALKLEQRLGEVKGANCTFFRMNNCRGYGDESCYCSKSKTEL